MHVIRRHTFVAALFAIAAFTLAGACGSSKSASGPGQLSLNLVDAAPANVDQIFVNVTKVTAHSSADGWVTVTSTPFGVDLLTLKTTPLKLGTLNLAAGTITQIRLYVTKTGNWVHVVGDAAGVQTPLVVPSGYESGIKINGPWSVSACEKTSVTLDFDGLASLEVHPTGTATQWILRPVVRVKETGSSPVACEGSSTPTCSAEQPCAEGQVCVQGSCVADGNGGGSAGSACSSADACLSASCPNGSCALSPPNGPCRTNGDCSNGSCSAEGSCAPCSADAQCPTGQVCTSGACAQPTSGL